jgi:hypothetical protein
MLRARQPLLSKISICAMLCCLMFTSIGQAEAIKTELVQHDGKWELLRAGKPYLIKGVGGSGSRQALADLGGNSFRTWDADNLGPQLDEAQRLGLSVTVGIWLGQERTNFSYNDADKVSAQYERARQAILKYKDHPAVLMWSLGNEMEGYKNGDNAAIWSAVNNIASMAKKLDPNHPTMTVIAELGGDRIKNINRLCPDIQIVGINTYAGITTVGQRYHSLGGVKPYVITEFGPVGTWETGKNSYGALVEPTSTQKAAFYRQGYHAAVELQPGVCLGSYAFLWGWKQEATATWFGMLLPDGTRTESVEAVAELWSGKPPQNHAPKIEPVQIQGSDIVAPGQIVDATVRVTDPDGDPISVQWQLHHEPSAVGIGGDFEASTRQYPDAIVSASKDHVQIRMPADSGAYRLYAIARDGQNNGATANVPLLVKEGAQPAAAVEAPAQAEAGAPAETAKVKLPLVIYGPDAPPSGYVPTGWMGNNQAIAMDEKSTTLPHQGAACLKVEYKAPDNFGGVVWQNPANNWGDQSGGRDLTGAKKLTFWARGENGGEKVEFKFGVLDKSKKFFDTGSGATAVSLTKDWKQYDIDLQDKDMSRIITGFGWVLAGQGAPVTFYLQDIQYE